MLKGKLAAQRSLIKNPAGLDNVATPSYDDQGILDEA
jgi:hypothetical protein